MEKEAKQVIVVRVDLDMKKGKLGAQVAHAACAWMTNRMVSEGSGKYSLNASEAEEAWMKGRFTKICLKVESEQELMEVYGKAKAAGLEANLITDAGLTVFKGPTKTCLGLGPDWPEKIDEITGKLKLL